MSSLLQEHQNAVHHICLSCSVFLGFTGHTPATSIPTDKATSISKPLPGPAHLAIRDVKKVRLRGRKTRVPKGTFGVASPLDEPRREQRPPHRTITRLNRSAIGPGPKGWSRSSIRIKAASLASSSSSSLSAWPTTSLAGIRGLFAPAASETLVAAREQPIPAKSRTEAPRECPNLLTKLTSPATQH